MACTPTAILSVPWGCQLMASNSRQVCGICQRVWDTVKPIVRPIPRTSITVRASGKRGDQRKNISPPNSPIIEPISAKKIGSITSFARVVNSTISRFATVVLISQIPDRNPTARDGKSGAWHNPERAITMPRTRLSARAPVR